MRIKNCPTRRYHRVKSDVKSEKINDCQLNLHCSNLIEDKALEFVTKSQNNLTKFEALNLEMKRTTISFNNELNITQAIPEVLDLSKKTGHLYHISAANITSLNSDSQKPFKDMYLYKILTNQHLLEDLKKSLPNSETEISNTDNKTSLSCQYCKRNFATEQELIDHSNITKNIHTNQVSCCACQKTFTQKRYLKYHQRCHSDKNKFTCDICRKKYSRLDNLTRHNIFHTNPNKFQCTYCDRTFARKDLLNKHVKGHENKKRYCCNLCQKTFKGPITLKNHNRILHSTNDEENSINSLC